MSNFTIYPLNLGTLIRGSERVGMHFNPGVEYTYPIFAWYLTDGKEKILIDTGGPVPYEAKMPYLKTEDQELDKALLKIGVKPEEITKVIFTHLHWDHTANNHLLPNARFYVQKKELHYAVTPLPPHIPTYDVKKIFETSYEIIDGDTEIVDGITAICTPGHTPGSQSIVVDTEVGKFVLIGDLTNLDEFWTANPKVANGVHHDLSDTYESFTKVEKIADYVLTGHDPKVLQYKKFPNGQFPQRAK